jgi:CheY-like chemotaxis protein
MTEEQPAILIVDDTPISRVGLAFVIRALGYETDEAESGFEAIDKLAQRPYSVVLMDCQMPGLDGPECAMLIREKENENGRHIPIIGMSASGMGRMANICLEAGMDDFVDKDCSDDDLAKVLRRWIDR